MCFAVDSLCSFPVLYDEVQSAGMIVKKGDEWTIVLKVLEQFYEVRT